MAKKKLISKDKRLKLDQAFFFNGAKIVVNVKDGEGHVEFDHTKLNEDYVAAVLHKAFQLVMDRDDCQIEEQEEKTPTTSSVIEKNPQPTVVEDSSAKEGAAVEKPEPKSEEPKPKSPKTTKSKSTKKKKKTTKKKTTQ